MKKSVNWKVLIISVVVVYLVAALGGLVMQGATSSEWYESVRPSITPPDYVFPIVWNILFFMIALSLYFAWIKGVNRKMVGLVFGVNFVLNILWSLFYFGMQNPMLAFVDLILLEVSIIWMIVVAGKIDKKAGWLLVPYLVWVGFAGVLNYLSI